MTEKRYEIKIWDESLQKWLNSQPNISEFIRQSLQDIKDGKLVRPTDSIDYKLKEATLRIKNATATIKEHEATHIETFGVKPSKQANEAIKIGAAQNTAPKPDGLDITKFLRGGFQDKLGWYHADCNRCNFRTERGRDFESAAVRDLESHILSAHKEAWK